MKLPKGFVQPDAYNVRGGVEVSPEHCRRARLHHCFVAFARTQYGFMSTTLDRGVAEKYSKGASNAPSVILEMMMGMVNRGKFWQSP